MNKFKQKWTIIIPLEPVSEGTEYEFTDWPLHITLASVFAVDDKGAEISNKLQELLLGQHEFNTSADSEDWFGPDKSVGVMKIKFTLELQELYSKIHQLLIDMKVEFNEPQYEGKGFIPHSAYQKTSRLRAGDEIIISKVALIDMFPNGNGYKRRVTKTIDLKV